MLLTRKARNGRQLYLIIGSSENWLYEFQFFIGNYNVDINFRKTSAGEFQTILSLYLNSQGTYIKHPETYMAGLQSIINLGAKINAPSNERGTTCLDIALSKENPNIIQILLENGANPNLPNERGITPLRKAMNLSIWFHKPGQISDPFYKLTKQKLEDQCELRFQNFIDIISNLLKHGANPIEEDIKGRYIYYDLMYQWDYYQGISKDYYFHNQGWAYEMFLSKTENLVKAIDQLLTGPKEQFLKNFVRNEFDNLPFL